MFKYLCYPQRNLFPICSHPLFPFPVLDSHQATWCLCRFAFFWVVWGRNTGLGLEGKFPIQVLSAGVISCLLMRCCHFFHKDLRLLPALRACAVFIDILSSSFGTVAWSKSAERVEPYKEPSWGEEGDGALLSLAVPRANCRTRASMSPL